MFRSLVLFLFISGTCFAQEKPIQQKTSKICLTKEEYVTLVKTLEDLLSSNQRLLELTKEYQDVLASKPIIEIDPLLIFLDEKSRVFTNDQIPGKLNLGPLNYDLRLKISGTVGKKQPPPYGFDLKFKAAYLYNLEVDENNKVRGYHSGGLAVESFHYKDFNLNLVLGSRFLASALGYDITEHFGILSGVGLGWKKQGIFFLGTSFDF